MPDHSENMDEWRIKNHFTSNLHAERFLVAFAVEAALATWNPGLCPPDEAGVANTGPGRATGGGGLFT